MTGFAFAVVERHIVRNHPDPQGNRQHQAEMHGAITAAPWIATVLDVERRQVLAWRAAGSVDYFDADLIATRLGQHAGWLWREWDWTEVPTVMGQLRADALTESLQLREQLTA